MSEVENAGPSIDQAVTKTARRDQRIKALEDQIESLQKILDAVRTEQENMGNYDPEEGGSQVKCEERFQPWSSS